MNIKLKKKMEKYISMQKYDYPDALREIKRGKKTGHWIWYIFPQITGLGKSYMCQQYDIQNIEGIANISLTETDMAVQIKDWRTLFFHFPHDGEYDSEEKYVRSIADFSERLGRKARLVQTKAPTIIKIPVKRSTHE